jgi:hypothetical protein
MYGYKPFQLSEASRESLYRTSKIWKENAVAKEAEYVTSEQLLQRLAQCESCGYVFQKGDRCFEKNAFAAKPNAYFLTHIVVKRVQRELVRSPMDRIKAGSFLPFFLLHIGASESKQRYSTARGSAKSVA